MNTGPEFNEVEQPFIDQLVAMGWEHTPGSLDDPGATGRESFRDVLLLDDLKQALRRLNRDVHCRQWLDEGRITQAVNALKRLGTAKLLEANQAATELLLKGTEVDGVEGWDGGRGRIVHFIDWDHPENNVFRVVSQFKIACPVGQGDKHIRPDLVLFVNGIPLVIIECKSPYAAAPVEEAVNQLQRYANRRRALGVVDINEGNEQLFDYSQFVVATCATKARVGTFSPLAVHAWPSNTASSSSARCRWTSRSAKRPTRPQTHRRGRAGFAHLADLPGARPQDCGQALAASQGLRGQVSAHRHSEQPASPRRPRARPKTLSDKGFSHLSKRTMRGNRTGS
jgi:hypothetical protein